MKNKVSHTKYGLSRFTLYTVFPFMFARFLTDHYTHFPIFQRRRNTKKKKKGSPYSSKYKVMPLANDQVDRPIQSEHLKSFLLQSSCILPHSYNAFILRLISTSSKRDTLALWWTHRGNFTLKHAGRSRHWPWVNSGSTNHCTFWSTPASALTWKSRLWLWIQEKKNH